MNEYMASLTSNDMRVQFYLLSIASYLHAILVSMHFCSKSVRSMSSRGHIYSMIHTQWQAGSTARGPWSMPLFFFCTVHPAVEQEQEHGYHA